MDINQWMSVVNKQSVIKRESGSKTNKNLGRMT